MGRTMYLIVTFAGGLYPIDAYIYENRWKAETARQTLKVIFQGDPSSSNYQLELFEVVIQPSEYERLVQAGQVGILLTPAGVPGQRVYLIPQDTGHLVGQPLPDGTVISYALYKNPTSHVKFDYVWELYTLRKVEQRDLHYRALRQLYQGLDEAGFTLDVLIQPGAKTVFLEGVNRLEPPEIIPITLLPALNYLGMVAPEETDTIENDSVDNLIVQVEAGLWQRYEVYLDGAAAGDR